MSKRGSAHECAAALLSRREIRCGNGEVRVKTSATLDEGTAVLFLFGNPIAELRPDGTLGLSDCGYQTNTTKAWLNAVLEAAGSRRRVYAERKQWYLTGIKWDGDAELWLIQETEESE